MKSKIKYAVIVLLAVDMTVLMAAPTTQPALPLQTATPTTASASRDTRQGRESGRSRRSRERGNGYSSALATPAGTDPFAVLDARSIFVKGNQSISAAGAQRASSVQSTGTLARKPESALVFNGVTVIDGQANAFIEDLTADRVSTVKVGDPIAGGKVSAISFDTMTYQGNGRTLNVTLGQNLEGNLAISTDMDSTAGAATTSPTTLPFAQGYIGVGGSSGVITQGMSQEDILARMKAKRQAEMHPK